MRKIFYDRIIRADERGVFLFAVTVFGVTAESDILSRRPLVNFFKVFVGNVFKRFAYGYTVPGVVVTLYELFLIIAFVRIIGGRTKFLSIDLQNDELT